MQIGNLGINHKSKDLELREKLARASLKHFSLSSCHSGIYFVLLTTCNRTEIYFSADDLAAAHTYILNVLRSDLAFEFEHKIYSYFGSDCFFHLAKVTAGMDSALLGETEIQGQVKLSYENALKNTPLNADLHFLFQKSLKIGKEIRSTIKTPRNSLEEAVFAKVQEHLFTIEDKKILFVGLSQINHHIIKKFLKNGFEHITICNRTDEKALHFAAEHALSILPWRHLLTHIFDYDLAIFATKAPEYLLRAHHLFPRHNMLLIDLSVPRTLDPEVSHHPLITLLNIDEITQATDCRSLKIENFFVAREVEKQMHLFSKREHVRLLVS